MVGYAYTQVGHFALLSNQRLLCKTKFTFTTQTLVYMSQYIALYMISQIPVQIYTYIM